MRKFLIALLAAIALLTAVNAEKKKIQLGIG